MKKGLLLLGTTATLVGFACTSGSPTCSGSDGGPCNAVLYDGGCPASPPAASSACSNEGLMCSWGSDARAECRTYGTCGGVTPGWQLSGGACGPPEASCPATAPDAGEAPCAQVQLGLTCVYSGSAYTCSHGCGGPIIEGQGDVWCVSSLDAQCPPYVPNLGTECQPAGLTCNYNACASGGMAVTCQGVWKLDFVGCADL
jgi:hypothetical protein